MEDFVDFSELSPAQIESYPKDRTLIIFDDHQSGLRRLTEARKFGFKHMMFEDNHPTATGDCYSIKQILDSTGRGYGTLPRRWNTKTLARIGRPAATPGTVEMVLAEDNFSREAQEITLKEHQRNREEVVRSIHTYAEFPPLLKEMSVEWFRTYDFFGLDCLPYAKRRDVVDAMTPRGVLDSEDQLQEYGLAGLGRADREVYHFISYVRLV
jgi:hypothetical protein